MSDVMREADEPIDIASQDIEGRAGVDRLKMTIERKYVPPLDGTPDDFQAFDNWLARRVAEMLVSQYYGYEWHVMADSRQGVIAFSIPEVMGPTLKWVIRLAEYADLTPKLILRCGGECLERMGLRRGPIDIAQYLAAKDRKHTFDFADVKQ
jgi:hypothetical protein